MTSSGNMIAKMALRPVRDLETHPDGRSRLTRIGAPYGFDRLFGDGSGIDDAQFQVLAAGCPRDEWFGRRCE
ncbi:hypothetical protein [Paenirhodobacter populi]|uniref:Uncharacterized protein n=1 Tax=Paenirhodobacter populi TaxID=2306993 RepID=A0A443JG72_9RHOB|nr:hypothetical protein [Sinirhodobacter populi]RWR19575.1 hypothetical protein D2T30_13780 [Sinirhodobacter populi]